VPADCGVLIAQMSDTWATMHWDAVQKGTLMPTEPLPSPVSEVLTTIRHLVGDLGEPLWINLQRWRYALPDTATPLTNIDRLVIAGDMVVGQGRVHLAIESAWRAADQIRALLTE
ncbi:MAG: FAD-dependent oxidoreductase, partial [Chloroflexus aggregans]